MTKEEKASVLQIVERLEREKAEILRAMRGQMIFMAVAFVLLILSIILK